jgi:hypothetical protein
MLLLRDDYPVWCPYCGQQVWLPLDLTGGDRQEYTEDCQTCCRPMECNVVIDHAGTPDVRVQKQGRA